jgi:hypothetical protein
VETPPLQNRMWGAGTEQPQGTRSFKAKAPNCLPGVRLSPGRQQDNRRKEDGGNRLAGCTRSLCDLLPSLVQTLSMLWERRALQGATACERPNPDTSAEACRAMKQHRGRRAVLCAPTFEPLAHTGVCVQSWYVRPWEGRQEQPVEAVLRVQYSGHPGSKETHTIMWCDMVSHPDTGSGQCFRLHFIKCSTRAHSSLVGCVHPRGIVNQLSHTPTWHQAKP